MDRLEIKRTQALAALAANAAQEPPQPLTVSQVMTVAPTCLRPDAPLRDLIKHMVTNGFRHLLVTDSFQGLLGVISDRDLLRWLGPGEVDLEGNSEVTAAKVMSTDLLTTCPGAPLSEAIEIMVNHGVSCLPVVTGETLVGILTNTDLQVVLGLLLTRSRNELLRDTAELAESAVGA